MASQSQSQSQSPNRRSPKPKKSSSVSPSSRSRKKAMPPQPPTLSEYLHRQLETVVTHNSVKTASPKHKVQVIQRLNDFIRNGNGNGSGGTMSKATYSKENLFSPIISDMHLTIQSGNSQHGKNEDSAGTGTGTSRQEPGRMEMKMKNGIQLPSIDWHQHFRKGYTILMWVRLRTHGPRDAPTGAATGAATDGDSSSSLKEQLHMEPQILYRFATSPSPTAQGIQATLHRDGSQPPPQETQNSCNNISCILRIETLLPPSPSDTNSSSFTSSMSIHSNSITTPIQIPDDQWTMIGIQHSNPYLKSPQLSILLNGVEVERGEISYPTLGGGDLGTVVRDNFLLCNFPHCEPNEHETNQNRGDNDNGGGGGDEKNGTRTSANANSSTSNYRSRSRSSHLHIHSVDFAGFGIYKESVPAVIQGIISEHGPSHTADGVIPIVPPVVQNRNAVVMTGDRNLLQGKKGMMGMTGMTGMGMNMGMNMNANGPFGLASNRSDHLVGRGIGIPLCTGVMLSSDGKYQGEILLQKLQSKLVLGLNASNAVIVGGNRVAIPASIGCTVGITDTPKIGVVQPKEPHVNGADVNAGNGGKKKRRNLNSSTGSLKSSSSSSFDDGTENLYQAKCTGNVRIFNVTQEYLNMERQNEKLGGVNSDMDMDMEMPVPTYNLPSSMVVENRPIPSFLDTYASLDSIAYILQAFHLSLPPPGYPHNLQTTLYQESFDHLHDLLIYRGGAFASALIQLFASNLMLGGRMREEILHSGSIHILVTLLRRVLLRASRLGMFSSKNAKGDQDGQRLWQYYAPREKPEDELLDIHAVKQSAPSHIPDLIVKACCSLVEACCGPPQEEGRRWKRSPLPVYIRRASDISLTTIFGFAFEMDLWGNNLVACAAIMEEVVSRYCSDGFSDSNSSEFSGKFDCSYGRLLRYEASVQYLLDIVRIRFGEEIILSKSQGQGHAVQDAQKSIATSLSRLLYIMLKYSLSSSKTVSQGEYDVASLVNALSDCQLGSIGSHAVLMALRDVMVYCEAYPLYANQSINKDVQNEGKCIDSALVSGILHSHTFRKVMHKNKDTNKKLKRMKTDILGRLGRNLLLAQFHDIVAPLLLSRTIFDGRKEMSNSESLEDLGQDASSDGNGNQVESAEFHWQHHWRLVLFMFTWIVSIVGPEGEGAAKAAGNLLLHSGKAGSLYRCLVTDDPAAILKIMIPPYPTVTSAVTPGNPCQTAVESHLIDLTNRLKSTIYLVGGLTAALLSQKETKRDFLCLDREAINNISSLVNGITSIARFILENDRSILGNRLIDSRRQQRRVTASDSILDKHDVKSALELVPPIVIAIVLFEDKIERLRNRSGSTDLGSWDFIEKDKLNLPSIEEQGAVLISCQEDLCNLAGVLIARAMIIGGGEASTIVWRSVISSFDSALLTSTETDVVSENCETKEEEGQVESTANSETSSVVKNNLLCRMTAIVLNMIVNRRHSQPDPWVSMEVCSATARLCDLVEEKKLLRVSEEKDRVSEEKDKEALNSRLTLDQVRLLSSLLYVMQTGRENTGWCQLVLPNPPARNEESSSESNGMVGKYAISKEAKEPPQSLLDAFTSVQRWNTSSKFVDFETISCRDEIYHVSSNTGNCRIDLGVGCKSVASMYPDSVASSKMLLPILQPTLRIALSCIEFVKGAAVVVYGKDADKKSKGSDSLLSIVVKELISTLTAAIVGLEFSNARDVCVNTLSILRRSIKAKEAKNDDVAAMQYRSVFLTVTNEMRIRHEGEDMKKKIAKHAYKSRNSSNDSIQDDSIRQSEAANASQIERLLLGNPLIGEPEPKDDSKRPLLEQHDSDDFVVFPHDKAVEIDKNNTPSPRGSASLGYNNYRGFKAALESCCNDNDDEKDVKFDSDFAFIALSKYLDAWDERQVMDDNESELVDLFDTKASVEHRYGSNFRSNLSNYASVADSMTSFIELASAESSRRSEIQKMLFPSRRYNFVSFTEKYCWKAFMEIQDYKSSSQTQVFERCMADGSRDYGGRIVSIPIHPQFPQTIPKQLDHSTNVSPSFEGDDENAPAFDHVYSLVQQGTLKVVDITKKENMAEIDIETDSIDGSDNVIVSKPSMESEDGLLEDFNRADELYLDFPDTQGDDASEQNKMTENEIKPKEDISIDIPSSYHGNVDGNHNNQHDFSMPVFANPPNTSSSSLHGHQLQGTNIPNTPVTGGMRTIDFHYNKCLHIKAEGNRNGTLFLSSTFLIFEYDDASGLYEGEKLAVEELTKKLNCDESDQNIDTNIDYERVIQQYKMQAAQRPRSMRWNITELSHVYLRRYRLRDSALEMFFIPSGGDATGGPGLFSAMSSILLDFGPGKEGNELRDEAANAIMTRAPATTVKQWPDKSDHFLLEHLRNITIGWVKGRISNFDYLLALNCLSGRSFNDLCQYPVFPWVLANYTSEDIPNLEKKSNYRDLTKPMGALNPDRLKDFKERFHTFDDPLIPKFMYGSHYSTSAGVVLHFLVRLHPFASLHRQLQGGHFDVADRLFSSVARTWDMCTGQSAAEVKELTPEWYCNPAFLRNTNNFKLGTSQDGETLGDVELPAWAKGSAEKFIEVQRCALESDITTSMLPDWIDLIFGRKQQGPEAVEANNVFFYLTYYGSCDVASIEDEDLRIATELQIAHFGQCPRQLFWRPHVHKYPRANVKRRLCLSEMLGVYDLEMLNKDSITSRQVPFESAPISHWVHLFAPPPGPHAPLIALRFVFPDRCVAVDAQGIYHFFRWAWRSDPEQTNNDADSWKKYDLFTDKGYFVAQRELPNFRLVPRLYLSRPKPSNWNNNEDFAVVAISKCLFAGRSLLVVSDADRKGGVCFQLVDPSKCVVQGEVFVRSAHSSRITAISMDPIGSAAGVGGVGGELAIIGSSDGTASLWRFITGSSCLLPLRPRFRCGGHKGHKIRAVTINNVLNLCVTVSAYRCCIFSTSNGGMVRSFTPPKNDLTGIAGAGADIICETQFVDSNAVCITSSGFIILVCTSKFRSKTNSFRREIVTLQLFSLEGVHIGSKALETWRGIPKKVTATYDGQAVMVCSGRGISMHLVSAIKPLYFIDEWQIGGDEEDTVAAHDIDFGPSPSRPVVAVTGLSSGALRIHALKGISEWSEENKKGSVSEAVGNVIGTVKGTGGKVFGLVKGTGSKVLGLGKDIGRETIGDFFARKINP